MNAKLRAFSVALGGLFLASGAIGLMDEVIWFRLLFLRLGGTGLSVATVTAAFMTGLGIGAYLFGRSRGTRFHPVRVYGFLEIGIGVYALAVPTLIDVMNRAGTVILGAESGGTGARLLRFFLAGLVLVPPTLAMGATLPVLARLIGRGHERPGRFIGLLYGLNTMGAVGGAGVAGFFLLPRFGLTTTLQGAGLSSVVLGVAALFLARLSPVEAGGPGGEETSVGAGLRPQPALAIGAYAISGFIAFILQVAWTRILALVFGSSVYAFTLILVVFLSGLGAGGLAGAALLERVRSPRRALAWCFLGVGALVLLGEGLYGRLPGMYLENLMLSGGRPVMGATAWLAAILMLPATFLLGAGFPLCVRLATGDRPAAASRCVGGLYGGNTVGSVLGAFVAALLLIPALTLPGAVAVAGFLALGVGVVVMMMGDGRRTAPRTLALPVLASTVIVVWWLFVPGWNQLLMSTSVAFWGPHNLAQGERTRDSLEHLSSGENAQVLFYRDGVTATVAVHRARTPVGTDSPGGVKNRFITVDGKVDASSTVDMPTQVFSGHLPMLLRRGVSGAETEPADVMIIGLATGVTAGSVLTHPIRSLVVVEIEAAMLDAYHLFDDINGRPLDDPRTELVIDDARSYLQRTQRRFDVIVSEPSSAWLSGPAKLFTREAFEMVRARLRPGGILCQWIQTYDLDAEAVTVVLRTLRGVFPEVAVFRSPVQSDLLLIASDTPLTWGPNEIERAWSARPVAEDLARAKLVGPCGVMEHLVADPAALLRAVSGAGPLNTDDNAWVEYRGPLTMRTGAANPIVSQLTAISAGALAMLDPAVASNGPALTRLANDCSHAESPRVAAALARASWKFEPSADAFWEVGDARRSGNQRNAALASFREALELDPQHGPSLVAQAVTLQELGQASEALAAWEQVGRVVGETTLVLAQRGQARLALGDPAGALADLERAARARDRPPLAIEVDVSRALLALGREKAARPWLEAYMASLRGPEIRTPGAAAAAARLGAILSATAGEEERGNALLQRAAGLRGQLAPGLLAQARTLLLADGPVVARAFVDSLCAQDPELRPVLVSASRTATGTVDGGIDRILAPTDQPSSN